MTLNCYNFEFWESFAGRLSDLRTIEDTDYRAAPVKVSNNTVQLTVGSMCVEVCRTIGLNDEYLAAVASHLHRCQWYSPRDASM